jgi:hypothetical protein
VKTFSKQQKFTVAKGTSPFTVTSDTKVSNLNSDYLDGYSESSFFRSSRGEVPVAYVDLATYTSGASDFQEYVSGTYNVARSGHSDIFIRFHKGTGSTSGLEMLCSYSDSARLKIRKTIDGNRVSGAWKELAFVTDTEQVKSVTTTSTYYLCGSTSSSTTTGTLVKRSNVYVNGSAAVYAGGGFYYASDETLKNFSKDIEIDFDSLKRIPKKYFTWKVGDTTPQLGTSAQVVRELYPEIVGTSDSGKLSVDYAKLAVIALAAIDKLHEENLSLKQELERIKTILNN